MEEYGCLLSHVNQWYIKFYREFFGYKPELSSDQKRLYHTRILLKTECDVDESRCDFNNIGASYYELGEYEKSAEAYENSINGKTFQLYPTPLSLGMCYVQMNESQKACEIGQRLLGMFSLLLNQTSSVIYSYMCVYRKYVDVLNDPSSDEFGEDAAKLEEKMREAVTELGKEHDNFTNRMN